MRRLAFFLMSFASFVSAAPMLRLASSVVTVQVAVGEAASSQTLEAFNTGDGSLSLSVSVPPASTWIAASVGAAQPNCSNSHTPCIPLRFTLNTASLALGTYTASVTVSDPHAVDSPQVVIVTLFVGTLPPTFVDRYLAPGYTIDIPFSPGFCQTNCPSFSASTQDGGRWLSVAAVFTKTTFIGVIRLAPPASMAPDTYSGSVVIGNSTDNHTIPVTMRVTTQPIAVPSASQITLRLAQGGPAVTYPFLPFISLDNAGMGTLAVENVTATGTGVSAYKYADLAIVAVDPDSLTPGTYKDGLVTIQCNAANCPIQVPVSLEVVPQGPPLIYYRGALDNATFSPGATVAQGDVMVVKGEQLSLKTPELAPGVPLPRSLGCARVLVNGVAAPLFYSSSVQIAFQMPAGTALGTALVQVERDGQAGNTVSVNVAQSAPRIVVVTDLSYNLRDLNHPARAGDTLILWAIGLGPTNPAVPDGAPAPASPPAIAAVTPTVRFRGNVVRDVTPSFAGLSPGGVGLYQVMVTVPADMPKGSFYVSLQVSAFVYSNEALIAVQ